MSPQRFEIDSDTAVEIYVNGVASGLATGVMNTTHCSAAAADGLVTLWLQALRADAQFMSEATRQCAKAVAGVGCEPVVPEAAISPLPEDFRSASQAFGMVIGSASVMADLLSQRFPQDQAVKRECAQLGQRITAARALVHLIDAAAHAAASDGPRPRARSGPGR
jgi:hypothetical protein